MGYRIIQRTFLYIDSKCEAHTMYNFSWGWEKAIQKSAVKRIKATTRDEEKCKDKDRKWLKEEDRKIGCNFQLR